MEMRDVAGAALTGMAAKGGNEIGGSDVGSAGGVGLEEMDVLFAPVFAVEPGSVVELEEGVGEG